MAPRNRRARLPVVVAGHVDHGKSTLVGRLVHDTGNMPEGRVAAIRAMCARRGRPFEWAFLTDALQGERDRAVTIDAAHVRFAAPSRDYLLIDAPGHREFLRNAVTGAARAEAALLVVDAAEGVREQSRRHACLLRLLGIRQVVAAISKADRVGYDRRRIEEVGAAVGRCLEAAGLAARRRVPVSARDGGNVAAPSPRMAWFRGPTLLEALEELEPAPPPDGLPLRLPVQDVYRRGGRRVLVGRVETGAMRAGDTVLLSPSNRTARIAGFEAWPGPPPSAARAGDSAAFALDPPLPVERGELVGDPARPPHVGGRLCARLFWLGDGPARPGARYRLKLNAREVSAALESVEAVIDMDDFARRPADRVDRGAVAEAVLRTDGAAVFDSYADNPRTGRFALAQGARIVGGGVLDAAAAPGPAP